MTKEKLKSGVPLLMAILAIAIMPMGYWADEALDEMEVKGISDVRLEGVRETKEIDLLVVSDPLKIYVTGANCPFRSDEVAGHVRILGKANENERRYLVRLDFDQKNNSPCATGMTGLMNTANLAKLNRIGRDADVKQAEYMKKVEAIRAEAKSAASKE